MMKWKYVLGLVGVLIVLLLVANSGLFIDRAFAVSGVCTWKGCINVDGDGSKACDSYRSYENVCDWDYGNFDGHTTRICYYDCPIIEGWDCSDYCQDSSCKCYGIASGPTCTNECNPGEKRCNGNYAQTCGNYDGDPCYEWGGDVYCELGCVNGECSEEGIAGIIDIIFKGIIKISGVG